MRTEVSYEITRTYVGNTGQRNISGMGLMDRYAHFYSPAVGSFLQPDTIISSFEDSQSMNRFSYVLNNPMLFLVPTGPMSETTQNFWWMETITFLP